MKRLDLILSEIADQLIENTSFGGCGRYTYYRHPSALVISKFSLKHRTKKHRKTELVKALKKCWLEERKFKTRYTDHFGRPVIERWEGRGIHRGVGRYLKVYRRRLKLLEASGYPITVGRPDELPEHIKVYLAFGCNITKKRIGIHLLNPTATEVRSALEEAETQGLEAVYIYEEPESDFRGRFVKTSGLAFNGTFRLTETTIKAVVA